MECHVVHDGIQWKATKEEKIRLVLLHVSPDTVPQPELSNSTFDLGSASTQVQLVTRHDIWT